MPDSLLSSQVSDTLRSFLASSRSRPLAEQIFNGPGNAPIEEQFIHSHEQYHEDYILDNASHIAAIDAANILVAGADISVVLVS